MMRINLLPPETLERRRAERRIGYVILGAVLVAAALAAVWSVGFLRVREREGKLASLQQEVATTNANAAQLAIFEQRATELLTRQTTVGQALGNRRDWARMLDEISLVLPADMWIQQMSVAEEGGIALSGYAMDPKTDSPDAGHKAVAKALVRLADLNDLYDVWLTSSSKATFLDQSVLQFSITAKVVDPSTQTAATATQASGGGQ